MIKNLIDLCLKKYILHPLESAAISFQHLKSTDDLYCNISSKADLKRMIILKCVSHFFYNFLLNTSACLDGIVNTHLNSYISKRNVF